MSAILAIKHKGHVYMAADSAVTAGDGIIILKKEKKIFKCGSLTIGYTGPMQGLKTLLYRYKPPRRKAKATDDQYIYDTVWNSMGLQLINDGVAIKMEDILVPDVTLLFVYDGRLFETDAAFTFYEQDRCSAIGVGDEYAQALLEQIPEDEPDVKGKLNAIMLKLIDKYNFVREPVIIERI